MSDNWIPFMRDTDAGRISINVDLGAADCDQSRLPSLVTLRLCALAFRKDGSPSREEFDFINETTNRIDDELPPQRARHVGRIAGKDGFLVHIYTCEPDETTKLLHRLTSHLTNRDPRVEVRPDPDWSVYHGSLCPTVLEVQAVKDLMVLENMRKHGDDLRKRRQIDHWLYFSDSAGCDRAEQTLREYGFDILNRHADAPEPRRWSLRVARVDSVKFADISQLTAWLLQLAADCGGEYDGWETAIIKGSGNPLRNLIDKWRRST